MSCCICKLKGIEKEFSLKIGKYEQYFCSEKCAKLYFNKVRKNMRNGAIKAKERVYD